MRIFFLILYLCLIPLFASPSIKIVSNSQINILNKPLYFMGELKFQDAYNKYKRGEFKPIPQELKSFGFSNIPLWICLEIFDNSDEKLSLSLIDSSIDKVTLYKYQNDKLIEIKESGLFVPKLNKNLENLVPKFYLEKSSSPSVYLIKVDSSVPLLMKILIGTDSDIINAQLPEIIILFIFIGSFLSLFIYNSFLYISTKESDYALYASYILSLVFWIVSFHGYLISVFQLSTDITNIIKVFSFVGISVFLILFSIKFLNVKQAYSKTIFIYFLISLITLLFIMSAGAIGLYLGVIAILITTFICFCFGIFSYISGYRPSQYYLLALGGYFLGTLITFLMFEGFLPATFFTIQAQLIGSTWAMIFLSLGLGYKIRLLHIERNEAILKTQIQEKILFLQSRQASVGELVGNIAHQWREPLAEIGSIQTNLKANMLIKGVVSKEKLLKSIEESYRIIRHLSNTIDVFYRFFRDKKSDKEEFNIVEEIHNIEKMVYYSLEVENISLECESKYEEAIVFGDKSEFINALLNIVLNAKDIISQRKILNPSILIKVEKSSDYIIIKIEDNAGGIKQEPIDKIFESCVSSKEDSIGIGLFITKRIIEQRMGGNISVKNSNHGALFTITLPLASKVSETDDIIEFYNIEESTLQRISRLERKVAEQVEIEKALKQWEDIFKQTHWGVSVHQGTSNNFEMVNPAFCLMYGYSEKELKEMNLSQLFSQESLNLLLQKQKEAFEKCFSSFEAIHIRKNGSTFPVNIDLTVIKNENGDILYHIANIRDISEQKKANEMLLLKKFAINHIHEAIYLIDKNGKFQYVNQGACLSLGYAQEELLQLGVSNIDPDWPSERWPGHWDIIKEKKMMTIESYHIRKDGTIFPVEIVANYFEYEGNGYNMALSRDITERREVEARKEDEKMRLFFERQLVGMAITSPTKGWLHVNDKLCEMIGYSFDELKNMTWAEVTHPDDLAGDVEQFERMLKGEIDHYFYEKRYIRKDGELVFTNLSIGCVRKDNLEVDYIIALIEDITERKKMEKEIKESHNFLTRLIDSIPDPIFVKDREHKWVVLNKAYCELAGLSKEQLIGKSDYDTFPKKEADVFWAKDEIVFTLGEININEEDFTSQDGITHRIETVKIKFNLDNKEEYLVGTIRDISERKAIQEKIETLNIQLEQRVKKRTEELEKKEREFRTLAENLPDFLVRYNKEGQRTYVNPTLTNYFGITAAELLGTTPDGKPLIGVPDILQERVTYVLKTGLSTSMEMTNNLKGKKQWFSLIFAPEFNDRKEVEGVISIGRDFTSLKEAEMEIKEREEKFSKLFKLSPAAISVTSLERGIYLDINESFLFNTGYTKDEVVGHSSAELKLFANPDDRAEFFRRILEDGVVQDFEYPFQAKGGRIGYAMAYASVITLKGERCVLAHSYDMTGKKEAEELLKKSEEAFRAMVENSPDVIMRYDLDGRRIYVNPTALKLMNKPLDEIIGKKPNEYSPLQNSKEFEEIFKMVIKEKKEKTIIAPFYMPDGVTHLGEQRLVPEFDSLGEVSSVLIIGRDITEPQRTKTIE